MRLARCLAILLMFVAPPAAAQQRATLYVGTSDVRARPSMGEPVIAVLVKGQSVTVLERVGTWARISSGRTKGWIRASGLTTNPARSDGIGMRTPGGTLVSAPPAYTPPDVTTSITPTSATARNGDDPSASRGLSIGLLGSATTVKGSPGRLAANHFVALPLILLQGPTLGAYVAPEVGAGAGYRSSMLGLGVTARVYTYGPVQLRATGGYATYGTVPESGGTAVRRSIQAASLGGLMSVRLFGTFRVAYRGQYVMAVGDGSGVRFQRHALGVVK